MADVPTAPWAFLSFSPASFSILASLEGQAQVAANCATALVITVLEGRSLAQAQTCCRPRQHFHLGQGHVSFTPPWQASLGLIV